MAAEHVGQQRHGRIAAFRNVHPDQYIVAFEQRLDFGHRAGFDAALGDELNLNPDHGFTLNPKEPHGALPLSERVVNQPGAIGRTLCVESS
jgi:hypothetical protein